MTTGRKIFWAFAWLLLAIAGAICTARQLGVLIFVLPVQEVERTAPAPRRGGMKLSAAWRLAAAGIGESDVTSAARIVFMDTRAAEQFPEGAR